jgi:hypothetical protein
MIDQDTRDEEITKALEAASIPVLEIRSIEPSLEDVFVTLTRSLQKQ